MPDFHVKHKDGEDYSASITFRQCLTHRTGLKHEAPIGSNYVYSGTFEDHINSINGTFLRFKPGEQYCYSNLGIDLAAYALGRIYEMPFEEYMLKKVFLLLEMTNSTYRQNDYLMRVDSAVGHGGIGENSLVKFPIMMIGGAGMYSCPEDMTRFIKCFLNQGVYDGQRIIKQEILEQMYNEYPASDWSYNLGLTAGLIKERTILTHNGGGFGFSTTQDIFVNNGLGAAALTNSNSHNDIQLKIIRNMWDDLFALQDAEKDDCKPIPNNYESLVGIYEVRLYDGVLKWKLAVIPRNGDIYCDNQKLEHHSGKLFFNEKNDCIEFTENGMIYDNVTLFKHGK